MTSPPCMKLLPMVQRLETRSDLSDTVRRAILDLPHRIQNLRANIFLARQGDQAGHCILILKGFTCQSLISGEGKRQISSLHMRGDVADLENCLHHQSDHDIQSLTAVEVARIPIRAILDLCAAHPEVARAFWADTMADASIFREWIMNIGQRDARQRVAHLICEIVLRQEVAGFPGPPHYIWPMTQSEVGDATGLTPVHVQRTFKRLRLEGLIQLSQKSVTILNWAGLQAAGDFNKAYLHHRQQAA